VSLGITQAAIDTIVAHTESERPRECCGLLVGTAQTILKAIPVENGAVDPFRQYEIDPAVYLAEIKRSRDEGHAVVGAYHSHPRGAAEPSPTDLEQAFKGFVFLIAGNLHDGEVDLRAFVLGEDAAFEEVTLTPM